MSIVFNEKLETRQHHKCQRCGGQLIRSHDEINCLQCGAPHTAEGKLMLTFSIQEYEALLGLQKTLEKDGISQEDSLPVLH